ncbi:MAG: methylenetetrahydrofolate reductase C-terminal domain-containing protein [bacterium]
MQLGDRRRYSFILNIMRVLRDWSIRHSRLLEWTYHHFAKTLVVLHPLWRWIGYERLERPAAAIERNLKGLMFDCKMCGRCVLSSTGMSCPMNCPKQMRNGPCGGVRADGCCEVTPTMPCVWVAAVRGSRAMRDGERILAVQAPVDWSQAGTSAWSRETRAQVESQVEVS